jgi:hypothetical protein
MLPWPEKIEKLLALRQRYRNGEFSSVVFAASLTALGLRSYEVEEELRYITPDPLQPDAEAIRLEESRKWLSEHQSTSI